MRAKTFHRSLVAIIIWGVLHGAATAGPAPADPASKLAPGLQKKLTEIDGETFVSVIVQTAWFRWTRRRTGTGRRVFRMAPLHHHFEKLGWPETRVVVRFYILGIIFALVGLATLKVR